MKNFFSTSFLFVSFAFMAQAQEAPKNTTTQSMGGGGFTIGYGYMDVSKLQVFVPQNVEKFNNNFMVIGGTGHAIINKFVIGGGGFGIVGDAIKTDSLKIGVSGGLGTFDFGYLIYNRDKVKIYPMLGIGGGGFGVQIAKNKNIPASHVASNPGQEINLNVGGFAADISINLNFIPVVKYDPNDNSYGGFMTGLKIGYVFSIPSSDWTFTGGDITGGPKFGMNMVYAKLVIGGFGYRK